MKCRGYGYLDLLRNFLKNDAAEADVVVFRGDAPSRPPGGCGPTGSDRRTAITPDLQGRTERHGPFGTMEIQRTDRGWLRLAS